VHSWFLLTGLGSVFLGLAGFSDSRLRKAGAVALGGGAAVVCGEVLRAWFPKLGETVPMALASGQHFLVAGGMGLVGLGTALLLWSVSAPCESPMPNQPLQPTCGAEGLRSFAGAGARRSRLSGSPLDGPALE